MIKNVLSKCSDIISDVEIKCLINALHFLEINRIF